MERKFYLDLAARGLRMPVGTHLVLHEKAEAAAILLDGERLGAVMAETARRFRTPLAIPVMDLMVEKATMLEILGVAPAAADTFHYASCPTPAEVAALDAGLVAPRNARLLANAAAIAHVARQDDLLPVGMCIGPFSLMTKLVADPITACYLAGSGLTAAEDEEVRTVETVLEMATRTVLASIRLQLKAGARLMFVCEPAANTVYLSPRQIEEGGSDLFERYVMAPNQRVRELLREHGADLLFHDCGELTPQRIARFADLDPAILSLGSSVKLWEAARVVPRDVVLYGNLPSKKFYSDAEVSVEQVRAMTRELAERMAATGHPFILGTECDVLSVPGCESCIGSKVEALLHA